MYPIGQTNDGGTVGLPIAMIGVKERQAQVLMRIYKISSTTGMSRSLRQRERKVQYVGGLDVG